MESKDPEMDYTFMRVCKRMIKQFCPDSNPKDVFRCLKNHKNEPAMEQKCKMVITRRQITKNTDYRLKPELQKACSKDVPKFCAEELKSKSKSEDEFQGIIIECLKIKYREHRLSQDCEGQIRITMQDAAMDYRLDAQLKQACGKTIIRLCPDELDQPGGGRVEECLKAKLNSDGITDEVCRKHVIRLLQEGKADIHVDPVLYKSCALDIKHFCAGIPPGEGRQMSCLLEALEDKSVRLNEECRHMLTQRVEMWEYAAKVAPPETVADLMQQIQMSPSRNYYIIILLCVVGSLFIGGLFCGRATKRIKAELKNK
ncbi:Golgi apparatus protein 1-like [Saccoglossus kowalevskii]|uniref:Golgi apparatus protein 1-like n=1 Tax=Saccoglossus kowalevskii TaxID=10224 RepID=A0ABM0MWA0_SACKO|nr:PREDICTED: Golgi apparatus protein 1-like [Saccoglossus kowalevskii]